MSFGLSILDKCVGRHFREARERLNPEGYPPLDPGKPLPPGEDIEESFIVGRPEQTAEKIAAMRDTGIRNVMFKFNTGEMDTARVQKSMRLFGKKVMPRFSE